MTEQTAEIQLNLNDFVTIVNIIDVCTERGAFKGNELLTIGTLREKLASFVKANTPQDSAAEASQEDSQEETESAGAL
jgi:hypothetical protein